ncbi:hypothetical protein [Faecalispora anaeroviscerum]|uniref:hypothetical protein n=1 Tax=Faecalispora anaeroviscerum TaxID=2991836 RepID=UPI0024BA3086|nr:hypothetical protein [Faecalispora anaeroviscerum]
MTKFNLLEQELLRQLQEKESLRDIRFAAAWENRRGGSEGISAFLKILPARFVPASLDESLRRAELTVSIWISAPKALGGTACVDAFSRISDALLFGENGLCLQTISCGKVEYSEAAGAFRMSAEVGMTAYCREGGG